MSRKTLNLTDELYQYVLDNTLREDDLLRELRARTSTMPGASMQVSPEQGQFMALLVQLLGARHSRVDGKGRCRQGDCEGD